MFSPFNSVSIIPEQTVKPLRPISRLNNVALSRTIIFLEGIPANSKFPPKGKMNCVFPVQTPNTDTALSLELLFPLCFCKRVIV